ncbi:hypothetical protein L1049_007449 [Liquidambar formosana]|uniref:Uncharacterized protein n=1 Tax=Liquidambar formosana TaxID=63359 RepID=A0AAP0R2B4_LIQFO
MVFGHGGGRAQQNRDVRFETANDVKNYWNTNLRKTLVLKETAQKIEKTSIIKPQPRKVSKVLPWLMGKTSVTENVQSGDDHSKPSSPLPIASEDANPWWESLLVDDDEADKGNTCCSSGLWDELITNIGEITPTTKGGDSFVEKNRSGWSDSFDMDDLWSLLNRYGQ